MKVTLLNSLVVACLFMTACSGSNPLLTQPPQKSAKFIFNASSSAQDVLDTSMTRMAGGYEACMLNEVEDKSYCNKLYDLMIKYARSGDSPYKDISLDQLTDKNAYEHFKKYLASAMFG